MGIIKQLREDIYSLVTEVFNVNSHDDIVVELPKDPLNGDLASNAAMVLSKELKKSPREIAMELKKELVKLPYVAHIEIAGPGFINFTLQAHIWQNAISDILDRAEYYSKCNIGEGKKVNIEYVSCNPTGPMHVGHGRGAVYGSALSRLMRRAGYDVVEEFYVNDTGKQISILAKSIHVRYMQLFDPSVSIDEEDFYLGEYIIDIAKKLRVEYSDSLTDFTSQENIDKIKNFAINNILSDIKQDLQDLGIKHDVFFYESSLYKNDDVDNVIKYLQSKNMAYEGKLPKPKGSTPKDWEEKDMLLFRSANYGDDIDRPIKKQDGNWTYFASDIAYAKNKIDRGFEHIVMILGADHMGYVKRMQAAIKAVSGDKDIKFKVEFCQIVTFVKDNQNLKMSKRDGVFETIKDILADIGKDAFRFMMLTRKNEAHYEFNVDKVKECSKDNPIFYVQYAYVRAKSIIENAMQMAPDAYNIYYSKQSNLSLLSSEEELHLMRKMAFWPHIIRSSAMNYDPQKIVYYLQELASEFHSLWSLGKDKNKYRFIIPENQELTAARLSFARAFSMIIADAMDILAVDLVEKM